MSLTPAHIMLFDTVVLFHFLSLTLAVAAIKIMAACVNGTDEAPLGPEWHQVTGGGNAICRRQPGVLNYCVVCNGAAL
jgi:hypothetical protein